MQRDEALKLLRTYKENHADAYGIISLGLFGSVARNEATEESDVDIVVQMKRPNLFLLSRIRIELEELFHTHVDIVRLRERMNEFLKNQITKDAVYV
jgi:hypothetical protein